MENLPPVILASTSPRRSELLGTMDIEFEVVPSHAEEVMETTDFIPTSAKPTPRPRPSRSPNYTRNAW